MKKPIHIPAFLLLLIFFAISGTLSAQKKSKIPRVVQTGENLKCGFTPKTDSSFGNFLRIQVSSRTEALIKLMDVKTDECIRMAFVNSGDSYDIKNIPEGKYYIKVAMGKEWAFKDSSRCAGEFKQIPIYKKLDRKFAFKRKTHGIDNYILQLDETTKGNAIKDEYITEKEFNK